MNHAAQIQTAAISRYAGAEAVKALNALRTASAAVAEDAQATVAYPVAAGHMDAIASS